MRGQPSEGSLERQGPRSPPVVASRPDGPADPGGPAVPIHQYMVQDSPS